MSDKRELDPAQLDSLHVYKIITGCVVPRPIGFITTVNAAGQVNAAPFSFFNALSHEPPIVCFAPGKNSKMGIKDTLNNVRVTGEFVANIVDERIVERVNACANEFPSDVNELDVAKLTSVPSKLVRPPRVAESPVNFECKVWRIIDHERLKAVGRMAGNVYSRTGDLIALSYDSFNVIPKT